MPEEKPKTGYEGTGQSDTYGKVAEEVMLPGKEKPVEKKPPEVKPVIQDKEKPKEEPKFAEAELKLPGVETEVVKKEGEEEEEIKEETNEEVTEELEIPEDEKKSVTERKIEKELKLDWTTVAKEAGIGELKENTRSAFMESVKQAIDDAKQKVAFDLSKYDEDTKTVIQFFENGGTYASLINPLENFYNFLGLPNHEKVKYHLMNTEKIDENAATLKVDSMDSEEMEKLVKNIDKSVSSTIQSKWKEIFTTENKRVQDRIKAEQLKVETERKEIAELVKKTDSFMGRKLSQNIRDHLLGEIETGVFFDKTNSAEVQMNARLFTLFGQQILGTINQMKTEENQKGYVKGKEEVQGDLHNIKTKTPLSTGVEQQSRQSGDVSDPLEGLRTIGSDAIKGF